MHVHTVAQAHRGARRLLTQRSGSCAGCSGCCCGAAPRTQSCRPGVVPGGGGGSDGGSCRWQEPAHLPWTQQVSPGTRQQSRAGAARPRTPNPPPCRTVRSSLRCCSFAASTRPIRSRGCSWAAAAAAAATGGSVTRWLSSARRGAPPSRGPPPWGRSCTATMPAIERGKCGGCRRARGRSPSVQEPRT